MQRRTFLVCLTTLIIVATAQSHDLFLKLDSYFLRPNSKALVRLINGTFQASDGPVARDRIRDVSIIGPDLSRTSQTSPAWRDEEKTTMMELQTAGEGTYLVGVSTKPREIALKAIDFNEYLEHDGLPDILADRKKTGQSGKDVRERYSKHVRAIFQVGNKRTDAYKSPLNYQAEIIPQNNPYSLKSGDTLLVQCALDRKPLINQFVIAGWESGAGKVEEFSTRTNFSGIASFKLQGTGKWYVKMIHMHRVNEPNLDYESIWATLTFEIK